MLVAEANLRDLGDLPTTDGRTVRTGRLFRSGYLCDLQGSALATVEGLGLRTIIDLRRPDEIRNRPHPDFDGTEVVHVSVSADDNEFAVLANRMEVDPSAIPGPKLENVLVSVLNVGRSCASKWNWNCFVMERSPRRPQ